MNIVEISYPSWTDNDIEMLFEEFSELYARKPIQDNSGGMKAPHAFAYQLIALFSYYASKL